MTNLPNFNQTAQRAEGIPAYLMNGLVTTNADSDTFEAWIATLTRLAEEHERKTLAQQIGQHIRPGNGESKPPLQKVAEGPWRSLGGYFDYSLWPDRERFLELDRAIAAGQEMRAPLIENGLANFEMLDLRQE